MNKKTLGLGLGAFLVGVTVFSGDSVLAYRGDVSVKGPNYSVERHEKMLKAFENLNYADWKDLMHNNGKVTDVITEQNFSKFLEARSLSLQGKTIEAQEIRNELGLGLKNRLGNSERGLGLRDGSDRYNGRGLNKTKGNGDVVGETRGLGKNLNN
jgi:hypothetical protein